MFKLDENNVAQFCMDYVAPHKLLYVGWSGSHLHGTSTENSDKDFKGLFLPSVESCVINEPTPDTIKYETQEEGLKNTPDDVDVELWSVQKWFDLLAVGDGNALSLLFSMFNVDMVLFADTDFAEVMMNFHKFYDQNNVLPMVGFARGQATQYGLKGSRLDLLESVMNWFKREGAYDVDEPEKNRLGQFDLDRMVEECNNGSTSLNKNLEIVYDGNQTFLKLLEKSHPFSLKLPDFLDRLEKEYKKYGRRAHTAKENDGNCWKALSHAMRSLTEAQLMLTTGTVIYPLPNADVLLDVKQGKYSTEEVTEVLDKMQVDVAELLKQDLQASHLDLNAKNMAVLTLYGKIDHESIMEKV